MKDPAVLPEGYVERCQVDLAKDRKLFWLINGLSAVLTLILFLIGGAFVPITALFDMEAGLGAYFLRFGVLVAGMILYIILHEAVHGVFMLRYGEAKVRFGFRGTYAYAGSDGYYSKNHYIIIALAPVVVWGIVLLILNFFTSPEWFWVVYWIQVCNLSGAVGDYYVTWKFRGLPESALIRDTGTAMAVYTRG